MKKDDQLESQKKTMAEDAMDTKMNGRNHSTMQCTPFKECENKTRNTVCDNKTVQLTAVADEKDDTTATKKKQKQKAQQDSWQQTTGPWCPITTMANNSRCIAMS